MADKLNSGDIAVNQVGNNVVVIDPNKITVNGQTKDRVVDSEDLIMYANLTAKIAPRSKLIKGGGGDTEVIVDIYSGELNFLKPEGKDFLDSDWTEAFTNPDTNKQIRTVDNDGSTISKKIENQNDFQGFGITSIAVKISASFIPEVTINFTDIRGKTLFEQARTNTPYTAFFHMPYPVFMLTLKGFYGKAVQYQLTLHKFVSRFDPSSGDYLVTCDFKGNHIALLRDINMHQAITAPYMYPTTINESTGDVTWTKGMQVLNDVYKLYAAKGLIDDDFPTLTIVQLIEKVKAIDNDLSRVFGEANLSYTSDKLEYLKTLDKFYQAIMGSEGWTNTYLDNNGVRNVQIKLPATSEETTGSTISTKCFPLKGMRAANDITDTTKQQEEKDKIQKKAEQDLNSIVAKYVKLLQQNPTFRVDSTVKDGKYAVATKFFNANVNQFKKNQLTGVQTIESTIAMLPQEYSPYFCFDGGVDSFTFQWKKTKKLFDGKAKQMEEDMSDELNLALEAEIGFKPTIRNVFAVILAGADTFLRLLDDVHTNAFAQRQNKKRLEVAKVSNDIPQTNSENSQIAFPWPKYYVTKEVSECQTSSVLTYIGSEEVMDVLDSSNKKVWPEVEFVEEYTKSTNYKFSTFMAPTTNDGLQKNFTPINNILDYPPIDVPYSSLDNVDVWFEILDRAQAAILFGSLLTRHAIPGNASIPIEVGEAIIGELSSYEGRNLYNQIKKFTSTTQIFRDMNNPREYIDMVLKQAAPERYQMYLWGGVVTGGLVGGPTFDFPQQMNVDILSEQWKLNDKALKITKGNGFFDVAPMIFGGWAKVNMANGANIPNGVHDFFTIYNNLTYNIMGNNILSETVDTLYFTTLGTKMVNNTEIALENFHICMDRYFNSDELNNPNAVDEFYDRILGDGGGAPNNTKLVTEGEILFNPTQSGIAPNVAPLTLDNAKTRLTSMMNTPYFINALLDGVNKEKLNVNHPYKKAAYLFLNSLPLPTFREKAMFDTSGPSETGLRFGDYISQLFNQMPALHEVPLSLLLKIGSIWWRYKDSVRSATGVADPLSEIWGDVGTVSTIFGATGPAYVYDEVGGSLATQYTYVEGGITFQYTSQQVVNNIMQVGVYPNIIGAIHYITTNSTAYIPATLTLNTIIPAAPLTIRNNTKISFNATTDNSTIQFYDVYLDSNNIINESEKVKFTNTESPGQYYVLFPSSGGLDQTDANTYDAPLYSNRALHNGACRLFWGMSNYGYFVNRGVYKPTAAEYFKLIDIHKDEQTDWQFKEDGAYSNIEDLRGVFNTEQLDGFEKLFEIFSSTEGSGDVPWTMKQAIKDFCVVEDKWVDAATAASGNFSTALAFAQTRKISVLINEFLQTTIQYSHKTTTNLNAVVNNSSLLQDITQLHYNYSSPIGKPVSYQITQTFGTYTSSTTTIPSAGGFFIGNPVEYQDMRIYVGEYFSQSSSQFNILVPTDDTNPLYSFFMEINYPLEGITFNSVNIKRFAPLIRLYGSYCAEQGYVTARDYIGIFMSQISNLDTISDQYINDLVKSAQKNIKENPSEIINISTPPPTDDRSEIKGDNLKLSLYNSFKKLNDRWIAGIPTLNNQTLFEKFLFLDKANRDIGSEAVIDIWDIILLDSPFANKNSRTLTQSVDSFLSIILANNYFNFIPLPSYINFFNLEKKGMNTQKQANALFGTFQTVDYLDSRPAFLCQYIGNSSTQLNVKTQDNGYTNDSYNLGRATPNPLNGPACGNKNLSNKVMGFNVDFGIPNQNIFESVTLDQSEYQNTEESYKILQSMADSGGGGSTSMASLSLFNVYASRSYSAKITMMGNVTIQPTQYFQLRYLPMFNGPYMIVSVEHNISPNNIETTFEGVRQPLAELPSITDLVQRVNSNLYQAAEKRLKELPIDLYYDNLSATPMQLSRGEADNLYIDKSSNWKTLESDNVTWHDVWDYLEVSMGGVDPEVTHLGIDVTPKASMVSKAAGPTGIKVYAALKGKIINQKRNCKPLQKDDGCGEYGNYVEIYTTINSNPDDDGTGYYKTRYAFLRENEPIINPPFITDDEAGYNIDWSSPGTGAVAGKVIGIMGNSGLSKDVHLHFEIIRGVKRNGRIVEQYLLPENFLPIFRV